MLQLAVLVYTALCDLINFAVDLRYGFLNPHPRLMSAVPMVRRRPQGNGRPAGAPRGAL